MTREYTNRLLEMIDEGLFGEVNEATERLISGLLAWMSEDDVKRFCQVNEYAYWMGLNEEEEYND